MVEIPAGTFQLGNDGGPPPERPQHEVHLPAFQIDRFQVTNADFVRFLQARGVMSEEGNARFEADDNDARILRRSGAWRGAIVKSCVWVCHAAARSWRSPFTNLTPRMIDLIH